jgi:hypothetical protein
MVETSVREVIMKNNYIAASGVVALIVIAAIGLYLWK